MLILSLNKNKIIDLEILKLVSTCEIHYRFSLYQKNFSFSRVKLNMIDLIYRLKIHH